MPIRSKRLYLSLLLAVAGSAQATEDCATVVQCNQRGTAAYQAENLRGGFEGVPPGLVESAEMAGFSRLQTFVHIRTPIALRMTFPALVNEAILILKASSLVSVVGLIELTKMAQNLAASTYMPLPIFASAGLIYLVINLVVAFVGNRAENALPGLPSK